MIIFLNGKFVPEKKALVSVLDRGFLYGDGLFESVRIVNAQPFRWEQHLQRFERGAAFLGIRLPISPQKLALSAYELIVRNKMPDSLLRLTLSRGVGPRGYCPQGANKPTLVMSLHNAPALDARPAPRWQLATASSRLPAGDVLAQFKTCNKLPQILARAEAAATGADEALLLNTSGHVVEASSGNLFWVVGKCVCTSPLAEGILPGVTRSTVMELCQTIGIETRQTHTTPNRLRQADGVFLSLSSAGIVEARSLDGHRVRRCPMTALVRQAYIELVRRETGARSQ